jgi:hypothetical protein
MKRRIKKNKTKKIGRMVAPKMDQKRLGPLEKPLRMADMYISLICMSVRQKRV